MPEKNPAYIQLCPTESALMSGSDSNNSTYHNIDHDAQQDPNGDPTYEVIPADTAGTSCVVRGAHADSEYQL